MTLGTVALLALVASLSLRCASRVKAGAAESADPTPRQVSSMPKQSEKSFEKTDLAYGADPSQRLDVYIPAGAKAAPILFVVHGGAWRIGDKAADAIVVNKVRAWRSKGYVVTSTNYRLDDANPLEQASDVAQALSFVQKNATSWGADPNKVVLLGHSSGAHLVSLLASDFELAEREACRPWLATVALDSAAYDVEAIMKGQHMRFYDRVFGSQPEFWREASPFHRLKQLRAPFLAVCSSARSDSCPQAEAFVAKARALGGDARVVPVPLSHREINKELGEPGPYTDEVQRFIQQQRLP
jgi:arylformamidase